MADNIFGMSIPELRRWSSRERVSAAKLNEPLEAIDTIVRGLPRPQQTEIRKRGKGGGECIPVSIIEAPEDQAEKLVVQKHKWEGDELVDDGQPITVRTWPDMNNDDYRPFIDRPDIFELVDLAGKLCVKHKIRQALRNVPPGAIIGGCGS